jgi:hypothetical protein
LASPFSFNKKIKRKPKKEAKQTQKVPTTSKAQPKNKTKMQKGGSTKQLLKAEDITDDYIDNLIN